ncbi:MAG: DUF58 domain-containing protein [Phycisphaerales bacterium]|nr:DUF58 domain-containing protein [Phycisphaerales bacterium]
MRRRFHLNLPGLLFVALTLFVGFAAANRPNNLVVWSFGALLSLILVSGIISGSMMVRLRLSRLETGRAAVGDPFEIRYQLTNTSGLRSAFAVRVDEILRPSDTDRHEVLPVSGHAWTIRVAPGEEQVCDAVLWPRRRGVLNLHRVRLTSFFPFGLMGRSVELELPQRVLVHPRVHAVRPDLLRTAVTGELGGIRLSRLPGPGEDFYSVREFKPGDSIRQIAWKRLGCTEDLLVIQRSSSAPPRVRIVLDLSTPPADLRFEAENDLTSGDLEERAITMAASLIAEADKADHEYGLTVLGFEDKPIPMRRGHWHRERLMASLAEIDLGAERKPPLSTSMLDEERSACIVIHPGRIDTRKAPDRALHWTATRVEDVLDFKTTEEGTAEEAPSSRSPLGVPA